MIGTGELDTWGGPDEAETRGVGLAKESRTAPKGTTACGLSVPQTWV